MLFRRNGRTGLPVFPAILGLMVLTGVALTGPNNAFLIHGDDRLGALIELHQRLSDAHVNVYASDGVTDGRGGYGYVLYVRPDEYETAAGILGV